MFFQVVVGQVLGVIRFCRFCHVARERKAAMVFMGSLLDHGSGDAYLCTGVATICHGVDGFMSGV